MLLANVPGMDFEPGDFVERRYGRGESRTGRISGRVREGYDTWYVTSGRPCETASTLASCDPLRNL